MSTRPFAVAIDGPAGAGKSTLAKILARELGFLYMDTGALYRTIGYAVLREGGDPADAAMVEARLPSLDVRLTHEADGQHVWLDGEDVNGEIRTPEVSRAASQVSALPAVRAYLLQLQRDTAASCDVIMDGRDIGTVVLPDAQRKIFLSATPEERARRRYEELREKGVDTTFEQVLADMQQRDYDDSHRAAAPLKAAEDAVAVNTTGETVEQSYLDPVYLLMSQKRHIYFMAKAELMKGRLGHWFFANVMGVFPVKRGTGDTGAIDTAVQLVKEGKMMGIFPEGTRSRDGKLGRGKSGAALIVSRTGAMVLPRYASRLIMGRIAGLIGEQEEAANNPPRKE